MIPVLKAIETVAGEICPLGAVSVELEHAVNRILAQDAVADTDLPPFDRSQMDGFAVRAEDTEDAPVLLKIVGESAAGRGWHRTLKRGEAVRIMTGAPLPKGADAVQKIELTSEASPAVSPRSTPSPADSGHLSAFQASRERTETISVLKAVKKGNFIVRKGAEIKKGAVLFRRGEIVTANMIAALAAFGYQKIKVSRRPRLAVLATGSEIVAVGEKPKKDQIRNSNSPMIRALAEKYGCDVEEFPIAKDDLESLRNEISNAARVADIVVITGGVSVGKYDLTKTALADIGARILFDRIRLKPGKPTVFATLGKQLIFGLPGNPVSVAVTFHLFVRAAILAMQGCSQTEMKQGHAVVAKAVKGAKERDTYLPASLKTDRAGRLVAEPLKWLGSSDFVGFARAEALIIVPRGKHFEKGDVVRIAWL